MTPNTTQRRRTRSGFTLIELIVVIVILAILAAIVVPRFFGRTEDAKKAAAVAQEANFDNCISQFNADTGTFPQSLDDLIKDPGVKNWKGPYLKNVDTVPMDPWDHPYSYVVPGANGHDYDVTATLPDGQHQIINGKTVDQNGNPVSGN